MTTRAQKIVTTDAWYLSIIAVAPKAQGRGIGRRLLEPTLAEADAAGVDCYLETFTLRNLKFYERMGFVAKMTFHEPTAAADYAIMVRTAGRFR
jgi:GNAT superfamily N-acetyltransferase